jgi:hypothetical protein
MPILELTDEQVVDLVKQLPPERQRAALQALAGQPLAACDSASIEQRFRELVRQWKEATRFVSSIHDMASQPAYLQIIGMGKEALPLLLHELRREPDHWFVALQAITGVNPIPASVRGNVEKMTQAWLSWAEQQGL